MSERSYASASQQTLLKTIEALGERPLEWQAQAAVVEHVGVTRDQTHRALVNLEIWGWAEQGVGGSWRLTPKLVRIAERTRLAIGEIHRSYLEDVP